MKNPELSIVMPVYNAEKYISDAIQSLLNQSFTDFELLVVDDGSTDRSLEIVKEFVDTRIKILTIPENKGIVYSRNRGLQEAKGYFYAPFDADDIAMPGKFEKQINFLKSHPDYAMVGSFATIVDDSGKPTGRKWRLPASAKRIPSIILFRNYFVHSSLVIRTSAIPTGGYETGFDRVEDYLMNFRICMENKTGNLPEYLLRYRIHQSSATFDYEKNVLPKDAKIYQLILSQLDIGLTEKHLTILCFLKDKCPEDQKPPLKEILDFLLLITSQNKKLNIYNQEQLRKEILSRWIKGIYKIRIQRLFTRNVKQPKYSPPTKTNESLMKATPDISILVPNYNNGKYLNDFIDSVTSSTVLPKELIIVDDGSTDDSPKILENFKNLPFLKVITFNENKGLTAALNAAIDAATGTYIMRADPDDKLHPERIEKQFDFMQLNPHVDVLGCNVEYFNDKTGHVINQSNFPVDHSEIVKRYSGGEHGIQHPTAFLRGDVYKRYRYQKIFPAEDYELFARMAFDGLTFANLKEPLYLMRVHKGSSTSNLSLKTMILTYGFRDKIFNTHTSRFRILTYFWHIAFYRKYQTSNFFILKYPFLMISAICYPSKLFARIFK